METVKPVVKEKREYDDVVFSYSAVEQLHPGFFKVEALVWKEEPR